MSEQISLEERARLAFARFDQRILKGTRPTLLESLCSEIDMWNRLARRQEERLRQLVAELYIHLRLQARSSSSDVAIWALAMATVEGNSALPTNARVRSLAEDQPGMLQKAAGEVLSRCQKQTELYLEPIENSGDLFLMLSSPSANGGMLVPLSYLRADKMHCGELWLALCRQVITESKASQEQHSYPGWVPGLSKTYTWTFNGTTELWLDLMEQLIAHPVSV